MRRSYTIALASVSCAIAVIAVVAQAYISTLTIALNIVAALAISLPLAKDSQAGAVFSYIATAVITFFAVNLKALPFIMLFGLYAVFQYALDFRFYLRVNKIPKWLKIAIIVVAKIAFFFVAFWGCISLMKVVIADINLFGAKWTLPLFMMLGFGVFCVYDPFYRWVFVNMKKIVSRYIKGDTGRRGKRNTTDSQNNVNVENKDDDIFKDL